MAFSVVRSTQAMVGPSAPTPVETLDLSSMDRLPGLRCKVRTFHVFRRGCEPAKVIREAMSKALVHYYPLAGRLMESSRGELQIACTGEGVWFVEASANCSLDEVHHLNHPLMVSPDDLLPQPSTEFDPTNVLVMMQVTEFQCGGFVIGLEFCHSICDGLGAAQFLVAVGEFAKGLNEPTVQPFWLRESIPTPPPKPTPPPPPFNSIPNYKLEKSIIDIPSDHINKFKAHFSDLTGKRCSTFEILAASVWQSRTNSISIDSDVELVFFANARPLIRPPLPKGFYGNCFFPVTVKASSAVLGRASKVEVVKLIQEAKAKLPDEFAKWAAGDGEDPYLPTLSYNTLFVSEWSRLGFGEVDYGWGTPIHVAPLTYSDIIPVCILGSQAAPKKGVRLITQCVEESHMTSFHELLLKEFIHSTQVLNSMVKKIEM